MSTTIVMVRHGETDWNRENRFQGHSDPPLNDVGRRQSRALAEALDEDEFAALYSSPLARALETAEILAIRFGVEVRISESLREIDVGSWEGLTTSEVEARFPDGYRLWVDRRYGWEDGETFEKLAQRVVAGLLEIAQNHPNERVLAVTHGGPIRSALAAAEGLPFPDARSAMRALENCAVVRVAVQDGRLEAVH